MTAFGSLLENLDLIYKFFWVVDMKYTPPVENVLKLLENAIFKQNTKNACMYNRTGIVAK